MSKLVTCKDCGAQISKSAKVCPQCGAKRKPSGWRVFFGIIMLFVGISIFVGAIGGNDGSAKSEVQGITAEKFNAIESGMTYDEVVNIVGSDGELLSQADIGDDEYKTEIYVWYGIVPGSNANVTFQGGKVAAKAQFGLS
mgnify:FL=1